MSDKNDEREDEFAGPVNLGNPGEITILEFGEKVIEKTTSNSQITHYPLPHDDPTQRKPDISLTKENLNWKPKIMFNEGLNKTIKYYKQIMFEYIFNCFKFILCTIGPILLI